MAEVAVNESNPALEDIKEIIETRPELTQEEWQIIDKATPWLKSMLKPDVRKELYDKYEVDKKAFEEEQKEINAAQVKEYMEEWRKAQAPLSNDELQQLLSQEYVEFQLQIKGAVDKQIRDVTICELPQSCEQRFVKVLKTKLIPVLQEVAAAEWSLKGSLVEQIQGWMDEIPSSLELTAELVAIILDPREKDSTINATWVKENLSTYRITAIIVAQVEANKYVDFFSKGSRLFRSLTGK